MKKETLNWEDMNEDEENMLEGEDLPFGPPPRYYKFRCTRCKFENEMNEANVDVAYGWTKKRTRTSDGEIVPVLECPNCSKWTYECID